MTTGVKCNVVMMGRSERWSICHGGQEWLAFYERCPALRCDTQHRSSILAEAIESWHLEFAQCIDDSD